MDFLFTLFVSKVPINPSQVRRASSRWPRRRQVRTHFVLPSSFRFSDKGWTTAGGAQRMDEKKPLSVTFLGGCSDQHPSLSNPRSLCGSDSFWGQKDRWGKKDRWVQGRVPGHLQARGVTRCPHVRKGGKASQYTRNFQGPILPILLHLEVIIRYYHRDP